MALSPTAVADASRYFDSWLMFRRRVERTPGVQAAILLGDAVVLDTAHGLADVESATALRTSHLFRIASHSKTFTATAIMQLVEQGAVRLDDTIGAWVAFTSGTEIASVTIRELLAHGGGLVRDGADGDFWQLSRPFLDLEGLEAATEHGAAIVPRNERFKYSNIGYSLLGEVVATASGTPYNRYVVDNVVTRVGLTHTGPEYEPRRAGEYATGYSSLGYAERRLPIEHVDTAAMSSATGFYSTASDVVRYASAHFFGDDRLVSDDSKRIMQRTEWKVEGTDTSYGLGFAIATIGGRRLLGHGGGYPGHITRTYFDPVDRFAVSVLTNAIDGPATAMAMAAVRLVDLANSNSNSNSSARADGNVDLTRFRGRFANLWGVFDIVDLGGRLYQIDPTLPDPTSESQVLEVIDPETLLIAKGSGYGSPRERLVYTRQDDGSIVSVRGGSGSTSYPIDGITRAVDGRDRVSVGSPLVPVAP